MTRLLEVRNLTTHFYTQKGIVQAVRGVSYEVAKGEIVALVGESGSGKTVSALSILRLIPDSPGKVVSGEVLLEGVDLLKLSRDDMRKVRGRKVSMIFQEPMTSLNPLLTIGRQISETLELHQKMDRKEAQHESVKLLHLVGIPQPEKRAKDYPHHFSGGMRQRVMIAMAISCHPQIILADEPTTALDVTIQAQLLELIRGITQELNTALLLITHNLGIVARYARRMYVMYAGSVVEHGPAIEIYRNPCHPYTVGLLSAVPRLDQPRKARLVAIEGQPPDLSCAPDGCSFQPRCTFSLPECKEGRVYLAEVAPGHYSSCRLAGNGLVPWIKT